MPRPKSKGAYAPLAAQYYLDDAILEAGPEAELLYVRCLSFLASVSTDGFLTDRQMKVVGLGLRNIPRRVETLLRAGLLEASPGGFVARSWLKWNKSAEELDRHLRNDRERKAQKPGENGTNSDRNPGGIGTESSDQLTVVHGTAMQLSTQGSDDVLELFDACWEYWPKKVERLTALARFRVVAKKRGSAVIARDVRKFGEAYAATTERQFTPALGAWLRGERWTDELPTRSSRKPTRTEENLSTVALYAAQEQAKELNQ